MSAQALSSRAVRGMYFQTLETQNNLSWMDEISNYFTSDQGTEIYPWLSVPPAMQEWIGGRNAKGFTANEITIENKHFEATLEILIKDLNRDKTNQLMARINEFSNRGVSHFAGLLSTLIVNGNSNVCYDGQYYFDTDHSEGKSGTQSNVIQTDINLLPAMVHGSVAAPSPEEMQQAILASINKMFTFVDEERQPLNESADSFMVMVPVGLMSATRAALTMLRESAPSTVDIGFFNIKAAVNPRLTIEGWTDKFVTFRTDGSVKPLIRQEETEPELSMKDENSDYAFDNDAIQVGIDTWRNVGYGRWQGAVLNQLV